MIELAQDDNIFGVSGVPSAGQEGFVVDTVDKANWAMAKLARAEKNMLRREVAAAAYKAKIDAWVADANKDDKETAARMTEYLKPYAEREIAKGKVKHVKLVGGQVGFRTNPDRLEVRDEAKALAVLPESCIRVKREVNKVAVKELIQQKGEIPDGVELVSGEVSWYAKVDPDYLALIE